MKNKPWHLGISGACLLSMATKTVSEIVNSIMLVGLQDYGSQNLSMGCEGDSGGPAYRKNVTTGELEVVGINSAVTVSPWDFKFDPMTSDIIGSASTAQAEMFITRLGIPAADDSLNTLSWLRKNLPESSFTSD
jgi:hypothetical protein